MKNSAAMFAETSSSWLDSLTACCGGFASPPRHRTHNKLRREFSSKQDDGPAPVLWTHSLTIIPGPEKDLAVCSDKPSVMPPPSFAPQVQPLHDSAGLETTQRLVQDEQRHGQQQREIIYDAYGNPVDSRRVFTDHRAGGLRSSHSLSGSRSRSQSGSASMAGRRSLSVRRRFRTHGSSGSISLFSTASSRRLPISAPTNFRHLHSETFVFPPPPVPQNYQQQQQRPPSFHPLELGIFSGQNPLSPLLSSIERDAAALIANDSVVTVPPKAHMRNDSSSSTGTGTLATLDRSYSAMSFHVPRRPIPDSKTGTGSGTGAGISAIAGTANSASSTTLAAPATLPNQMLRPPAIPPRSRLRSNSSPAVESMVERIASAMIEMERLQAEIDSVIERQSIYISSRPTTAYDQDFEPMPSIPALPAAAPSFAERLSTERPQTAPPRQSGMMAYDHSRSYANDNIGNSGNFGNYSNYGGTILNSSLNSHAVIFDRDIAPLPLAMPLRYHGAEPSIPSASFLQPPKQMQPLQQTQQSKFSVVTASQASLASAASVASAAAAAKKAAAVAAGTSAASTSTMALGGNGSRINGRLVDVPLAPPLPLVLRPPLRKKKSFSRVSHWLSLHSNGGSNGVGGNNTGSASQQQHTVVLHGRGMSFDSVTNQPRPVTEKEGFYQCLVPAGPANGSFGGNNGATAGVSGGRTSSDSLSTVDTLSTWTTEREQQQQQQQRQQQRATESGHNTGYGGAEHSDSYGGEDAEEHEYLDEEEDDQGDGDDEDDDEDEFDIRTGPTAGWSPTGSSPVTGRETTSASTPTTATTVTSPAVAAMKALVPAVTTATSSSSALTASLPLELASDMSALDKNSIVVTTTRPLSVGVAF